MSRNPNLSFYNPPGSRHMSPARGSASSPSFSIPISQAPPLLLVIGLRNPTTPHHLQHGTCHFPSRVHDSLRANDSLVLSCPRWDIHPSHMPCGLFSLGGLGDRGLRLSALRHPTTAMNQLIRVCAKSEVKCKCREKGGLGTMSRDCAALLGVSELRWTCPVVHGLVRCCKTGR